MRLRLPAALALVGPLSGCAWFESKPEALNMNSAVLKAESYESQESLADYYAKAAADLQLRANDARLLGSQYEGKTYLYGKNGRSTIDLSGKLAELYERAATYNQRMADIHRQAAALLPCKPIGIAGKGGLFPCHSPESPGASEGGAKTGP